MSREVPGLINSDPFFANAKLHPHSFGSEIEMENVDEFPKKLLV
jgi:hypothetical protein